MAPTSDERREVAARLRWLASDPGAQTRGPYGPSTYAITCDAIFGQGIGGPSETQFLNRLADLIDPTCRNEYSNLNDRSFLCSKCGYEAFTYDDSNCDPDEFEFCPHCGARVVEGGE